MLLTQVIIPFFIQENKHIEYCTVSEEEYKYNITIVKFASEHLKNSIYEIVFGFLLMLVAVERHLCASHTDESQ